MELRQHEYHATVGALNALPLEDDSPNAAERFALKIKPQSLA